MRRSQRPPSHRPWGMTGLREEGKTMTDMTIEFARQMVAIARAELDRMKPEWERFTQMREIGEGWLRDYSKSIEESAATPESIGQPVTLTEAVRQVLVAANGQPLHWRTILKRARQRGAESQAKNTYSVVNTACRRAGAEADGEGNWRLPVHQETFVGNGVPESHSQICHRWSAPEGKGVISRVGTPAHSPQMAALG